MSQILTPGPTLPAIPPADYSAVDFETAERRVASYSGSDRDDVPGNDAVKRKKQKKRESKDDSWVDILVNSQSRRIAGQDVDPSDKHPHSLPGGDPDMASLEVAQVLAAVRGNRHERSLSPSLGSLSSTDEEVVGFGSQAREHGPSIDMDAHVEGLEIDEVERVPRRLRESVDESESSVGHDDDGGGRLAYDDGEEYAADDEDHSQDLSHSHSHHLESEAPPPPVTPQRHRPQAPLPEPPIEREEQEPPSLAMRHALKQQRRLGYFDMHPERKKLYSPGSGQSPDEDDEDDFPLLQPHSPGPLGVRASATSGSTQFGGSASPDVPSFDSSIEKKRAEMERSGLARADSVTLPPSLSSLSGSKSFESATSTQTNGHPATTTTTMAAGSPTAHPIGPRAPAGAAGAGTKTAALIEMYKERERRAQASPPAAAAAAATTTTTPTIITPPSTTTPPAVSIPAPAAPQPLAPSRIPTRTASLPGATNPNANISTPPTTTPEPVVNAPPPDVVVEPPPRVGLGDPTGGRASPARYVHGAPLHNVIEEEEEE